jgi:hypothetical protein
MKLLSRLVPLASLAFGAAIVTAACGSSGGSEFGSGGDPDAGIDFGEGGFIDGAGRVDGSYDPDAFFATDPPPKYCGPDGGTTPATPGGTPECPSDKNREGCPCTTPGEQKPCWPGLRVNRGLGVCKDGVATCKSSGEFGRTWGPCENFVGPVAGATKGKEACKCFSAGKWAIKNLSPCLITYNGTSTYGVSTQPADGQCYPLPANATPPPTKPAGIWSEDSLKVDCAGHFRLCYTLKAGDFNAPSAADCSLATVCTESDYTTVDVEQTFPPLDSWTSNDPLCSKKFADTGGYGEMTVKGLSVLCDEISENGQPYVFHRVQYCKLECQANPTAPGCANCLLGGSGDF